MKVQGKSLVTQLFCGNRTTYLTVDPSRDFALVALRMPALKSFQLTEDALQAHLEQLQREFAFACGRFPDDAIKEWAKGAARTFAYVTFRRGKNLGRVGVAIVEFVWSEASAVQATPHKELPKHLRNRVSDAAGWASSALSDARVQAENIQRAFRADPVAASRDLLTGFLAAIIVSGGPDANGGVPDLDLAFGIDAHRSIFFHSLLSGALLEAAFLSLASLVDLVHRHLPDPHHPLWDSLREGTDSILLAAMRGSSVGLSYHLAVDGLVQIGAYHDLPMSAPIEVHQTLLTANAAAEALDVGHKRLRDGCDQAKHELRKVPGWISSRATALHDAAMKLGRRFATEGISIYDLYATGRFDETLTDVYLRHVILLNTPFSIAEHVKRDLDTKELGVLQRHGRWMDALSKGHLQLLTGTQLQFYLAALGAVEPTTPMEMLWRRYKEALDRGRPLTTST